MLSACSLGLGVAQAERNHTGALWKHSRSRKNVLTTTPYTTKLFFCRIMRVHILDLLSKPTWKQPINKVLYHLLYSLVIGPS